MAYEDPNNPYTPLPAALGPLQQSTSLSDPSIYSSGEKTHPWRRLFARMIDNFTLGFALTYLALVVLHKTMPEQARVFAKSIHDPINFYIFVYLICITAETLFISMFGATPGKWLFGIRIRGLNGKHLSFLESFCRSILVVVQGVGLGIPIITLFTQIFAYKRLKKTHTTLWDEATHAVVLHKKWGVFRALICTAMVIISLFLIIIYSSLNSTLTPR